MEAIDVIVITILTSGIVGGLVAYFTLTHFMLGFIKRLTEIMLDDQRKGEK